MDTARNADPLPEGALEQALRDTRLLQSAPASVVDAALALFQHRPQGLQPHGNWLRRLQGLLSFDSRLQLAAGVRGLASSEVRQLVFTAPGCDVDLRIERGSRDGRVRVTGQLLGPKPEVQALIQVGDQDWQADCDELSEFRFDDVPVGPTLLRLRGSDWELALPSFDTQG